MSRLNNLLLGIEVKKWLDDKQSYEDTITVLAGTPWNFDREQAVWLLDQAKRKKESERDT